jgi:hypothetical protein
VPPDAATANALALLRETQPLVAGSNGHADAGADRQWLVAGAALLAEPDPGPVPWLIENLVVDQALIAAVGRWKVTKSYAIKDACISIVTGRPLFGTLTVPQPGPVVYVCEESGRAPLHRRLGALCRGRAVDPDELADLHLAANARVKLDDPRWQNELLDLGRELRPRLFVFDPLARMKAPARDENAQPAMAAVVEFMRELRSETGAGVCFVHHTGHSGDNMRGSSDLESVWETRLAWKRDGQSPLVTIESEHREAEAGDPIAYRIVWDHDTRSMRFNLVEQNGLPSLEERIVEWLRDHRDQRAEVVAKGLQMRVADVRNALERLKAGTSHGTTHSGPSGRLDATGRPIRDKVWNLSNQAELRPEMARPASGTTQDVPPAGHRGSVARPVSLETGGTDEPPDEPHDLFHDTEPDPSEDDELTEVAP